MWMERFPPHVWSRYAYGSEVPSINTNNHIERHFRSLKEAIQTPPPPTIDVMVDKLYDMVLKLEKEHIVSETRTSTLSKPLDDLLYRIKKKSEF
jgi:hypothetical protein